MPTRPATKSCEKFYSKSCSKHCSEQCGQHCNPLIPEVWPLLLVRYVAWFYWIRRFVQCRPSDGCPVLVESRTPHRFPRMISESESSRMSFVKARSRLYEGTRPCVIGVRNSTRRDLDDCGIHFETPPAARMLLQKRRKEGKTIETEKKKILSFNIFRNPFKGRLSKEETRYKEKDSSCGIRLQNS